MPGQGESELVAALSELRQAVNDNTAAIGKLTGRMDVLDATMERLRSQLTGAVERTERRVRRLAAGAD